MAPRWPKTAPREAQERPKTAPRAPQEGPLLPSAIAASRFGSGSRLDSGSFFVYFAWPGRAPLTRGNVCPEAHGARVHAHQQ